jgi:hypothetical protein
MVASFASLVAFGMLCLLASCAALPIQSRKEVQEVSEHKPIVLGKEHLGLGEQDMRKHFDLWKTRIAGSVRWTKVSADAFENST